MTSSSYSPRFSGVSGTTMMVRGSITLWNAPFAARMRVSASSKVTSASDTDTSASSNSRS